MVQTLQSFSVVCFTLLQFVNPLHLPSYITPCGEPNLDECAYKSALKAIPHLLKGDKKYHIPVLDPLQLPFVSMDTATGLNLNISDIVVTGLKGAKLKSLHFDIGKQYGLFRAVIPTLVLNAHYVVSGKILVLPISGSGPLHLELDEFDFTYDSSWELEKKDGKEYAKLKDPKMKFTASNARFKIDNLFNGDKLLGDNMNKVLNENWKDVINEIGGGASRTIEAIITQILGTFLNTIPYNEIFIFK